MIDVQVFYEVTNASFKTAQQLKVARYTPLEKSIKDRYSCNVVTFHILTIGSRGSFYHKHLKFWIELKFLAINVMESSIKILSSFHKSLETSDGVP